MLALLVALLYFLCFAAMGALVSLIAVRSYALRSDARGNDVQKRSRSRLHQQRRVFFLLALCLLSWQLTLFLEAHMTLPVVQLYLGRANFTAIVFVVYFALSFVRLVAKKKPRYKPRYKHRSKTAGWLGWLLLVETVVLAVVTLLTPLVTAEEWVVTSANGMGHPVTRFGPLFPPYLLHVIGYWLAAIGCAFQKAYPKGTAPARRKQLLVIGAGIAVTGSVAVITNALLPYGFGDFRFCDVGTLATLCFLVAVAYAVFVHNLFDLRLVVRQTLVFGLLLAFVVGAYSSSAFMLTQYLSESSDKATQFVVLLLAFSFDPLRRFLEDKVDRLLFGRKMGRESRRSRSREREEP